MIHGTYTVKRVRETSTCTLAEDARLDKQDMFKIYAPALMPDIQSGDAQSLPDPIDTTCIKNGKSTSVKMKTSTKTQNYIMAKYVGKIPYDEKYLEDPEYKTPAGTKFTLTCLDGNPNNKTFQ